MRARRLVLALGGFAAMAGCSGRESRNGPEAITPAPAAPVLSATPPSPVPRMAAEGWRRVVTPADRQRLSNWRTAFVEGLAAARTGGQATAIAREAGLLEPDAALDSAVLPPGDYRCRVLKIGSKVRGVPNFTAYPAYTCRVSRGPDGLMVRKLGGSQRLVGMLYPEDDRRMVFLGTLMLGDETRPMTYGRDPDRDMVGALERVGPQRWRLLLPYPRFESTVDVVELVPAA